MSPSARSDDDDRLSVSPSPAADAPGEPRERVGLGAWRWRQMRLLDVLAGTVIGLLLLPAVVGALATLVYGRGHPGPVLLWSAILQEVGLFGLGLQLLRVRLHLDADELGAWLGLNGSWARWLLYGVAAGVGLLLAEGVANLTTYMVVSLARGPAAATQLLTEVSDPVAQMVRLTQSEWQRYLLALVLVGVGPVAEEVWFRGVVYPACRVRWGPRRGNVVLSVFFATLHLNGPAWLALFAVGVLLAAIYERTRSLWPGIIAHATLNAVAFLGVLSGVGGGVR